MKSCVSNLLDTTMVGPNSVSAYRIKPLQWTHSLGRFSLSQPVLPTTGILKAICKTVNNEELKNHQMFGIQ